MAKVMMSELASQQLITAVFYWRMILSANGNGCSMHAKAHRTHIGFATTSLMYIFW